MKTESSVTAYFFKSKIRHVLMIAYQQAIFVHHKQYSNQ